MEKQSANPMPNHRDPARLRRMRYLVGHDELTPMMKAIKAVHSATSSASTSPDDLERQRAGQELFGRLVTPAAGLRFDSLTIRHGAVPVPAEWVSQEDGHDPPPCRAVLPRRRLYLRPAGLCARAGQQAGAGFGLRCAVV